MTDCIRGVEELVGCDCLQARTAALARFEGLGPPDLCVLHKRVQASWAAPGGSNAASEAEAQHFFHYVIGLDVVDVHNIASYIHGLVQHQEKTSGWPSWFVGQTWEHRGGLYCCYDAFSRLDIRVTVPPEGGSCNCTFVGVDANGVVVQVHRDIWEGLQLSAYLRAVQPPPRGIPGLRAMPLFTKSETVDAFVWLSTRFFSVGDRLEGGLPELNIGSTPLRELFCGYLVNSRRLNIAFEALPSLQSLDTGVVIHIADAYVARGQIEAALNVLVRAAREDPNDGAVQHGQATALLEERSHVAAELALASAENSVRLVPYVWKFWVTLARAFLECGKFSHCLAALNAPPLSTVAAEEANGQGLELGLPDFAKAERTVPSGGFRRGLVALRPSAFLALPPQRGAVQFGGYGAGFGLNPGLDDSVGAGNSTATTTSTGAVTSANLDDGERRVIQALTASPGASLTSVEKCAYEVLVSLHRQAGWDELVRQRSKVFLIDGVEEHDINDDNSSDGSEIADSIDVASVDHGSIAFDEASCIQGLGRRLAKRICSKFLDKLFQALLTDLNIFNEWCRESEAHTRRPVHSSGLVWMHRGALAVRLQQDVQAEVAFRLCQARCACPRASLELLRIYSSSNQPVEAVAQLAVLCGLAAPDTSANDPKPWARSEGWPDWLFEAAAKLICRFGLQAIHAAAGQLPDACRAWRFALAELLQATKHARVEGCER